PAPAVGRRITPCPGFGHGHVLLIELCADLLKAVVSGPVRSELADYCRDLGMTVGVGFWPALSRRGMLQLIERSAVPNWPLRRFRHLLRGRSRNWTAVKSQLGLPLANEAVGLFRRDVVPLVKLAL